MDIERGAMSKTGLFTGMHHVAMRVADFDASMAFYGEEGLGLPVCLAWGAKTPEKDDRAAMLACGSGSHIELFANGPKEPKPEGAWIHVALTTPDCDAAWSRALKAGAKPQTPPFEADINDAAGRVRVKIAFCLGLDGEVIEFFQAL